eukprot:COSAG04_NODE_140_length_23600_cov_1779.264414_16_plen_262_part_00
MPVPLCLLLGALAAPPNGERTASPSRRRVPQPTLRMPAVAPESQSGRAAACSLQADCAIAQYCDDTHSCYECSVLNHTKVKCDALDGDCCSAAFLQNCPSNPKGCAPPPKCDAALASACGSERGSLVDCLVCGGVHASTVRGAGCSNDDIHQWCATGSTVVAFPVSRLITDAAWGRQLNGWAGTTGREWALCCSTFEGCDTAAKFHAACDAHTPTLTVAHNAGGTQPWSGGKSNPGNFTFGGFVRSPPKPAEAPGLSSEGS